MTLTFELPKLSVHAIKMIINALDRDAQFGPYPEEHIQHRKALHNELRARGGN